MGTQSTVRYTQGPERKMGEVHARLSISNAFDQARAEANELDAESVRSIVLEGVLVDTGATLLCLPTDIIGRLGLDLLRQVQVMTAAGAKETRIFSGVHLEVEGRRGTFDCLELPDDAPPLLGLIPLEALGLEPDLQNRVLRLLPESGPRTHLHA